LPRPADGEETRTLTSRYKPTLLDRYPRSNYKSAPLPPHVWMVPSHGRALSYESFTHSIGSPLHA